MKTAILALATLFAATISTAQTLTVKTDAVKISFVADMQNTPGTVSGFVGKIFFNMDDLANSVIQGNVDASTIDTGNEKRDEHLKSADFFEVETYPTMSFTSTKIEQDGDKFIMTGTMKIKDKSHEETITFSFVDNVFKGECTIQASEYGIYEKKGPKKTNVKITFEIPVE